MEVTYKNLFPNGANDKKLKLLYSSDHPISFKFHQLVVNMFIKEF